jgi:hypothetical protein
MGSRSDIFIEFSVVSWSTGNEIRKKEVQQECTKSDDRERKTKENIARNTFGCKDGQATTTLISKNIGQDLLVSLFQLVLHASRTFSVVKGCWKGMVEEVDSNEHPQCRIIHS